MSDTTSGPIYDTDEPSQRKIVTWRVGAFERLGIPTFKAYAVALRRDIDREDVANMVAQGCAPDLVVDIVL